MLKEKSVISHLYKHVNGTGVNWTFNFINGESLEITSAVPLAQFLLLPCLTISKWVTVKNWTFDMDATPVS